MASSSPARDLAGQRSRQPLGEIEQPRSASSSSSSTISAEQRARMNLQYFHIPILTCGRVGVRVTAKKLRQFEILSCAFPPRDKATQLFNRSWGLGSWDEVGHTNWKIGRRSRHRSKSSIEQIIRYKSVLCYIDTELFDSEPLSCQSIGFSYPKPVAPSPNLLEKIIRDFRGNGF